MAASLLLRLESLSADEEYVVMAQETLETFAGVVEHLGLHAATYALALQRMLQRPVQICVVGEDALARRLEAVALARYAVNKSVIRLRQSQISNLPPVLGETLALLPRLRESEGGSFALVCSHNTCQPPVTTVSGLMEEMNHAL